jgi:6-phosphogluconolactonase (cycloisomerase 2 family)
MHYFVMAITSQTKYNDCKSKFWNGAARIEICAYFLNTSSRYHDSLAIF